MTISIASQASNAGTEVFTSPPRFVQLPTDFPKTPATSFEAAVVSRFTVAEGAAPLHAPQAQRLLAAWVALLYRYTQQETLAFDLSVAALGAFAVALSVQVSPESEPDSLLEAVSGALPQAISVSPNSGANTALTILDANELAPGDRADEPWAKSDYDLQVVLWQQEGRLLLSARYNAQLLKESTVLRLAASFAALLAGWGASSSIKGLPLFSREEERAFTAALDCPRADYPQRPVWQLISERATKAPEAPAAFARGEQLSYGELEERSNQLANWLLSRGVGPGNVVAVCLGPSLETLVAMLAIWKVRGVYVPLDPTHPRALVERMLQESSPAVVLTASAFSELSAGFPQLLLDALDSPLPHQPGSLPVLPAQLDDVAYVFYTSGTTGKPKGVVATQRNLVQYVHSAAQRYGFQAGDVFSAIARTTFSISMFELVSPLCCGGSVRILQRDEVLTPERLCSVLAELTVFHAGPSLLATLFRYLRSTPGAPRAFPGMRHASSGGDLVPPSVMEELKTVFPNAELFVIYGCTEVSCMGTTFRIERDRTVARSFVGKAFPNVRARVLDAALRVVPSGVVGEICFSGPGVVRGYFDRPELTAEKFVDIEGERYYRTGDVGRLHADGELEILGRRDFQVQLRGIRIELAGIERTILELGLAAQCAVVAKQLDSGDLRLIAFVVKPTEPRPAAFRRVLSEQLPDYAIPAHVVTLDAMPLTANGKLDRNQLAQRPLPQQSEAGADSLPSNERELKIAEIFAKVLGVDSVGVESSFFELGGDSLLGVAALQEIQRSLGVVIAPQVLFQSGTVRALAAYEENVSAPVAAPILLNRRCDGPTVFFLSGIHTYRELARCLDGRCNAYGVFAPCELESLEAVGSSRSVEELAAEYVALIRAQQPTGPYHIVGYSFAGIVAYEVARQLRESGQRVGLLSLIDAMLPEWCLGWRFRRSQLRRLWSAPSRDVASWILRRVRGDIKAATADFLRYQHDQRLGPLENARNGLNQSAAEAYLRHVPRYQGEVTLFVSEKRVREDPLKSDSCGWAPYIDSLQIERLDADHFKMMSNEPFVSQMAKTLDRCLGSLHA